MLILACKWWVDNPGVGHLCKEKALPGLTITSVTNGCITSFTGSLEMKQMIKLFTKIPLHTVACIGMKIIVNIYCQAEGLTPITHD